MPESLGEKLRQAREEKGVSISEVAEQTRISASYLESIENDDYRPLPGGIFNKGFVKSFAKYVGLDEAEAMQDYAVISANQKSDEENISKGYRPEVLTDNTSGPSMLPTILLAIIILGLGAWGILALVNYVNQSESQTGENSLANNNVKTVSGNSNTNTNTRANLSTPSLDSIKLKMTSTAKSLSITATIDGKAELRVLNSEITEQSFEAEESLKLRYTKWEAKSVQLTINGKKIETPLPPPGYKRKGFEYEINMSNLKQILQDGKISFGVPGLNANTNTAPANTRAKPIGVNANVPPN